MGKPVDRRSPLSIVLYVVAALIVIWISAAAIYGAVHGRADANRVVRQIEDSPNG